VIRLRSIALVAQVGLAATTAGIAVTIATLIPDLLHEGSRVRVVGVLYDTTGFNGCDATAASPAP
jgi:hypothetical protein